MKPNCIREQTGEVRHGVSAAEVAKAGDDAVAMPEIAQTTLRGGRRVYALAVRGAVGVVSTAVPSASFASLTTRVVWLTALDPSLVREDELEFPCRLRASPLRHSSRPGTKGKRVGGHQGQHGRSNPSCTETAQIR